MNTRFLQQKISLNLVLGLAIAGLCACHSGSVSLPDNRASANSVAPVPVAQKLSSTGRWLTDAQGRVVIIHGTNMINKLAPYTPDALGFGEEDLRFLAENGFNGIRLGFTWAGVEPEPGQYDDAYIDKIVTLAANASTHGMLRNVSATIHTRSSSSTTNHHRASSTWRCAHCRSVARSSTSISWHRSTTRC